METNLDNYSNEDLYQLIQDLEYNNRYNKLERFFPYQWQKDFMKASLKYHNRYLRAGNQTGKTASQGIEFSSHITGKYPSWYEGIKIGGSGNLFWCIGIDLDATANVMMYELFGVKDIRNVNEIGTGSIPKANIDFTFMKKDGARLISCRIKHIDGGFNTLQFYSAAQGASKMMGSRVKYVWIDEIPVHNAMEIYTQAIARTINTDGYITITATPEQGRLELDVMFEEDETERLFLQQISWSDCPHITDETAERLLAAFPEWQHSLRRDGLPVIGTGAVFPFKDSEVMTEDSEINQWDEILWAIDIGHTNDPTVITLAVKSTSNQGMEDEYSTIRILEQYVSDEDRSPIWVHSVVSNHTYCNAPMMYPHDASGNEGYAAILGRLGLNIPPTCFHNPTMTSASVVKPTTEHCRSIEAGLYYMEQYIKEQKLKIHGNCASWFKEKTGYYRTGKSGAKAYAGSDHSIDSSRYAFMSLLGNRGLVAGQCQKYSDAVAYNNGWGSDTEYYKEEQYLGNSKWES